MTEIRKPIANYEIDQTVTTRTVWNELVNATIVGKREYTDSYEMRVSYDMRTPYGDKTAWVTSSSNDVEDQD